MDIINKTVNIEDPELLKFFFPDFQIKSKLSYRDRDNNIIYTGAMRRGLIDYLESNTKNYISIIGKMDVDLTQRENMIKFVFSKYGKNPAQSTIDSIEMVDDEEFIYTIKVFWMIGKWLYKMDSDLTIFDLFKSSTKSINNVLSIYFKLLDIYPHYVLESSFLTFIQRAVDVENQEVSASYIKLLERFNTKSGSNVKGSIMNYIKKDNLKDEMRFVDLLLNLK